MKDRKSIKMSLDMRKNMVISKPELCLHMYTESDLMIFVVCYMYCTYAICRCMYSNGFVCLFDLVHYIHSQQLRSCRDGHLT